PRSIPFADLCRTAGERSRSPKTAESHDDQRKLAENLLRFYLANLVSLHLHRPPFVLQVSDRPIAASLARVQAARGLRVACLRHSLVDLAPLDRIILPLLDGSRDRATLVTALEG